MTGKHEELMDYLTKNDIHVAAIQETKFTSKSNIKSTKPYTMVRKDRGKDIKGGGLAILVHESIPFQQVDSPATLTADKHIEELTISITNHEKKPMMIRNLYIPPDSSCEQGYAPNIPNLSDGLGDTFLLLGDFNAHNAMWHTDDNEDARGRMIADWVGDAGLGILNEDTPTRITGNSATAPDISIATADCMPTCNWNVETSLSSDHLPIVLRLSSLIQKVDAPKRTFVNFKKADWTSFTSLTEDLFANATVTNNVRKNERTFRKILQKAAKLHIPAGRIPKVINAVPTTTANLMEERDQIRRSNPADPRLPNLNHEINMSIKDHRQAKWSEHLSSCGPGSSKLWSTIKGLNQPVSQPANQSINFGGKHYIDPE